MTPADKRRRSIQERILDQVKAHTHATDAELAGWVGVERSLVSRWRDGTREMGLLDLLGLIRGAGDAQAVLQPLADAGDCDVVPREGRAVDLEDGSLDLSEQASHLARQVHQAMADGTITHAEREDLRRIVGVLHELLHSVESTIAGSGR